MPIAEIAGQASVYLALVVGKLIEHYRGLEQPHKVLDVCDALVAHGLESADVHVQKGQAQMELRSYQAAKASFERALQHKPDDAGIRRSLAEASRRLRERP